MIKHDTAAGWYFEIVDADGKAHRWSEFSTYAAAADVRDRVRDRFPGVEIA